MNKTRFFDVTERFMRQFCSVIFTLLILSLFSVFMAVETKAETYEYDDLNRVTKVIYDDQSFTLYEYDANGNIISQSFHEKDEPASGGDAGGQKPGGGNTGGQEPGGGSNQPGSGTGTNADQPGGGGTAGQKNPADKHKVGMKAKSKQATYVITSVKKKTATFYRLNTKKKTSYTVPDTVKIDDVIYKVTKIDSKAFKNQKKLKKVTIGKNITSIGKQAFYGCKKLKTITVKTTKLKTVGKQAFKGIHKKATIKVPKKKYKKYKKLLKGKGQKKTVKIRKR